MSSPAETPVASPAPYRTAYPHPTPAGPSSSYLEAPSSSSRPLLPSRLSSGAGGPVYHRHPGCVLCSLIIAAEESEDSPRPSDAAPSPSPGIEEEALSHARSASPSADAFLAKGKGTPRYSQPYDPYAPPSNGGEGARVDVHGKEIVYQDQQLLVYRAEGKERLCNDGRHLVIVPKQHFTNVYELGPPDVPLLSHMLETAQRLLPLYSRDHERKAEEGKVGFVGSVMRDPGSSYPHLHAHATVGPLDAASWMRRTVVYSPLNWWSIEDLRAEIREESSNNRVKSGYPDRSGAPIDNVPDAGSRAGLPNALDQVEQDLPPQPDQSAGVNVVPPTPDINGSPSPTEGRRARGKGREL